MPEHEMYYEAEGRNGIVWAKPVTGQRYGKIELAAEGSALSMIFVLGCFFNKMQLGL